MKNLYNEPKMIVNLFDAEGIVTESGAKFDSVNIPDDAAKVTLNAADTLGFVF